MHSDGEDLLAGPPGKRVWNKKVHQLCAFSTILFQTPPAVGFFQRSELNIYSYWCLPESRHSDFYKVVVAVWSSKDSFTTRNTRIAAPKWMHPPFFGGVGVKNNSQGRKFAFQKTEGEGTGTMLCVFLFIDGLRGIGLSGK